MTCKAFAVYRQTLLETRGDVKKRLSNLQEALSVLNRVR